MKPVEKLKSIRSVMQQQGVQGFIQPLHDEYLSEYPPACAQRVRWLCGFSGSAGTLVVLQDTAALFTDGRYTLQAAKETDETLFEQHNTATLQPDTWIAQQAEKGSKIGYDARLFTASILAHYEKAAKDTGITLVPCDNLIDSIWTDRPAAPATPLFVHELKYSGMESSAKHNDIATLLREKNADSLLLTAPDSVCWLLNIRASDVEHTPLALCNAVVWQDTVHLFMQADRISEVVRMHLGEVVQLHDPKALQDVLAGIAKAKKTVLCDMASTPLWHLQALKGAALIEISDPCQRMKALKNPVEIKGMRAAHIRDGVAVTTFLHWLDSETKSRDVTELECCDKLQALRTQHDLFHDLSFPTIAGSGPNGAIVHYRADEQSNRTLQQGELLLLDSGGQYPDGTTDITRTVPIGQPSAEMCDRFTRVLKGHIALAMTGFPAGTTGSQLDALARQYLWQAGLDYDHGTGHGVGCFLSVHEGPQRISKRGGDVALAPGMILSNEPGYYKTGAYGIRIENLVTVVESTSSDSGKTFLGFDTITCVPIDTRLIDTSLMTDTEKQWLNSYHAWVLAQLKPSLDEDCLEWLTARCAAV